MTTTPAWSSLVFVTMLLIAIGVVLPSRFVYAQQDREPAFQVTSVKANRSGAPAVGGPGDRFSRGQFHTTNIPLRMLIRESSHLDQKNEIVCGHAWLETDQW